MVYHKTVTLNTGAIMPTVGLGTWKSAPGQVEHAVEYALKSAGYKHIDTAYDYGNEAEVGQGIKASGVPRGEIFLTTKLPNAQHGTPEKALEESLAALDTYIDLWLMHWPAPMKGGKADKSINWIDTWKKMEAIYEKNKDKVRAIGVSNIGIKYLNELLKEAKIVPAVNQVELHPVCIHLFIGQLLF
ncbi:Aldo/keto reductase [Calocera cornea HHB12733]|uniref:Aldo/keto reductase n=1 Tax=Calocera cornea HHB12733 TaxID=1353952 RepID=A0A165JP40_9BASI|nr:Aldo/keto reductase [Calocera cornea HHB12733]